MGNSIAYCSLNISMKRKMHAIIKYLNLTSHFLVEIRLDMHICLTASLKVHSLFDAQLTSVNMNCNFLLGKHKSTNF